MLKLIHVIPLFLITPVLIHSAEGLSKVLFHFPVKEWSPVDNAYRYFNRLQKSDNDQSAGTEYRKKGFDDLGWAIHRYAADEVEKILASGRSPNHQVWTCAQRQPFITTVVARNMSPMLCAGRALISPIATELEMANQKIIDLLIKHKANVNIGRKDSSPFIHGALLPLWEAIKTYRPDNADKLIKAGAHVYQIMIQQAKEQEANFKKYYDFWETKYPEQYKRMTHINETMVTILEAAYMKQKMRSKL